MRLFPCVLSVRGGFIAHLNYLYLGKGYPVNERYVSEHLCTFVGEKKAGYLNLTELHVQTLLDTASISGSRFRGTHSSILVSVSSSTRAKQTESFVYTTRLSCHVLQKWNKFQQLKVASRIITKVSTIESCKSNYNEIRMRKSSIARLLYPLNKTPNTKSASRTLSGGSFETSSE